MPPRGILRSESAPQWAFRPFPELEYGHGRAHFPMLTGEDYNLKVIREEGAQNGPVRTVIPSHFVLRPSKTDVAVHFHKGGLRQPPFMGLHRQSPYAVLVPSQVPRGAQRSFRSRANIQAPKRTSFGSLVSLMGNSYGE